MVANTGNRTYLMRWTDGARAHFNVLCVDYALPNVQRAQLVEQSELIGWKTRLRARGNVVERQHVMVAWQAMQQEMVRPI